MIRHYVHFAFHPCVRADIWRRKLYQKLYVYVCLATSQMSNYYSGKCALQCMHCTTYRRKMSAGYFTLSGNYETALAFQFNIVAALDAGVLVYKKDTLSLTYANTDVWFSQFLHRFSFKNFKYLTFVSFFKYLLQNFIVVVVVFIFLLWLKMNNKNSP